MTKDFHSDFEKSIGYSLDSVSRFNEERTFRVVDEGSLLNGEVGVVKKRARDGFTCNIIVQKSNIFIHDKEFEKYKAWGDLSLENAGLKYYITKDSVKKVRSILGSSPNNLTLHLTHFQSGVSSEYKNQTFRLIIPVKHLTDFSPFETKSLKIGNKIGFSDLIEIKFHDKNFHLFRYSNRNGKKSFLFVDALQKSELTEFKKDVNAILLGFGYITGDLHRDEYYYQVLGEEDWKIVNNCFEKLKGSIITKSPLLAPIPFSMYMEDIGQKHKLNSMDICMKADIFSKLIETIRTNDNFATACLLRIEGIKAKRTLLKAGIFSIGIETLTNIIYTEYKKKINPIGDDKLAALIKSKFSETLEEYEDFVGAYGMQILNAKIANLNTPTNSKKLSMPFELFGIRLLKKDIEILNHRNKFLHGTQPKKSVEDERELADIVYRLQFMMNALLLKYVGYRGHLINGAAMLEFKRKEKVTDHLFKII